MSADPSEILFRTFGIGIEVTEGSDGLLYDGFSTPHQALLEADTLYSDLEFAQQMMICAVVSNRLSPAEFEDLTPDPPPTFSKNRTFLYTYEWHLSAQDYACVVFDQGSGNLVFDEWFKTLQTEGVMESVDDVEGLIEFLVHSGELLNGDTLIVEEPFDDEDED